MKASLPQILHTAMNEFFSLSAAIVDTPNIMFRRTSRPTETLDKTAEPYFQDPIIDDSDAFTITTIQDSENTISYDFVRNIVNLNNTDGGFF